MFGHDPAGLGSVLVRLALASDTAPATALLKSLLAFSALHRHGVNSQAIELKISALKYLGAASNPNISTAEAMQHIATGMLLCSFEVGLDTLS